MALRAGMDSDTVSEIIDAGVAGINSYHGITYENKGDSTSTEKLIHKIEGEIADTTKSSQMIQEIRKNLEEQKKYVERIENLMLQKFGAGYNTKYGFEAQMKKIMAGSKFVGSNLKTVLEYYKNPDGKALGDEKKNRKKNMEEVANWFAQEYVRRISQDISSNDNLKLAVIENVFQDLHGLTSKKKKASTYVIDFGDLTFSSSSKKGGDNVLVINNKVSFASSLISSVEEILNYMESNETIAIFLTAAYAALEKDSPQIIKNILQQDKYVYDGLSEWLKEGGDMEVIMTDDQTQLRYDLAEISEKFASYGKRNKEQMEKRFKDKTLIKKMARDMEKYVAAFVAADIKSRGILEISEAKVLEYMKIAGIADGGDDSDFYFIAMGNASNTTYDSNGEVVTQGVSNTKISGQMGELYGVICLASMLDKSYTEAKVLWTGREKGGNMKYDEKQISYDVLVSLGASVKVDDDLENKYRNFGIQVKNTEDDMFNGYGGHRIEFLKNRDYSNVYAALEGQLGMSADDIFSAKAATTFNVAYELKGDKAVKAKTWKLQQRLSNFDLAFKMFILNFSDKLMFIQNDEEMQIMTDPKKEKNGKWVRNELAILDSKVSEVTGNVVYIVGGRPYFASDIIDSFLRELTSLDEYAKLVRNNLQFNLEMTLQLEKTEKSQINDADLKKMNSSFKGNIISVINSEGIEQAFENKEITLGATFTSSYAFGK